MGVAKEKREALKAEQLAKADHAKRMELKRQMEAKAKLAKESKVKAQEIKTKAKPGQVQPKIPLNGKSEKPSTMDMSSLPPGITVSTNIACKSTMISPMMRWIGRKEKGREN